VTVLGCQLTCHGMADPSSRFSELDPIGLVTLTVSGLGAYNFAQLGSARVEADLGFGTQPSLRVWSVARQVLRCWAIWFRAAAPSFLKCGVCDLWRAICVSITSCC
jgi:hypothetical protein